VAFVWEIIPRDGGKANLARVMAMVVRMAVLVGLCGYMIVGQWLVEYSIPQFTDAFSLARFGAAH
jgi:hypothetical protein